MIMSIVSIMIMNVTEKTLKSTTHQYQKEQAALLARSYTELAILYVMYYDRSSDCLETITDHFGDATSGYDIDVRIKYIGNANLLAHCSASSIVATLDQNITGFYSTISLVVDTYIHYKDFDDPSHRDSTFHRRTLQKL
jgi:hypothetical protein